MEESGVKRLARWVACAGVVGVLALAATAALAATPTAVSKSEFIPADEQSLVEAKCPKGKGAISGGFTLDSDESFMANSAEGAYVSNKRWSINSGSFGGAGRSTAFAYCSPLARDLALRSDRTELEPGDSATVTATCRKDERVMSGGYAYVSSGFALGLTTQSRRADARSWSINGSNFTEDKSITLLVFANCLPKRKAPMLTTEREAVPFIDDGSQTRATAKCPRNRYALSGGFSVPGQLSPEAPRESRRAGTNGWTASAGGIVGRDDKFSVFAYCAKK